MKELLKNNKKIFILSIICIIIGIGYIIKQKNTTELIQEDFLDNNISKEEIIKDTEEEIVVHIAGEVNKPGIVRIKEGSRIEDVIKVAGGLTEKADITNVNLAYIVQDGIKIKIPSIDDDIEENSIIISDVEESSSKRR